MTSLRTDTGIKPDLYAAAGVPEYWVVDVDRRRVHAFSMPTDGRYARCAIVAAPASIASTAVETTPLELASLFSGLRC